MSHTPEMLAETYDDAAKRREHTARRAPSVAAREKAQQDAARYRATAAHLRRLAKLEAGVRLEGTAWRDNDCYGPDCPADHRLPDAPGCVAPGYRFAPGEEDVFGPGERPAVLILTDTPTEDEP